MSRRTKYRFVRGFAACCLILFAGLSVIGETIVRPLIDDPSETVYADAVARALDRAEWSILVLLSNCELECESLVDRLIAAYQRGVSVRVVLDSSDWEPSITERNRGAYERLDEVGIEVAFDDPSVTAHAKLVVVDRRIVFLGSTHWNRYALTDHRQADICVEDDGVGEAFAEYIDRLWDRTLPPEGLVLPAIPDGASVVALPDTDGTLLYATTLLGLLRAAQRSIHAVLYRVSVYPQYQDSVSNDLVDAVCDAAARGLDVRVLIDDCRFYEESANANLASALVMAERGVSVRFDTPEQTTHAKLVVIDGETVVIGSTNWNYYSLERNVETNVAILRAPEVAASYEAHFEVLWDAGRAPGA